MIITQVFVIASQLCDEGGSIKFHLHFINVDQKDHMLLKMIKIGGEPFPIDLANKLESWEQAQGGHRLTQSDLIESVITVRSLMNELSGRIWVEEFAKGGFSICLFLPCKKKEGVIV